MTRHQILTYSLVFIVIFLVTSAATMLLQPTTDDWFFLNYFPNSSAKWNIDGYRWFSDCRLLMRDFWRPLEDIFLSAESTKPELFPYLNHLLAVTGAFLTAAGVWNCCLSLRLNRKVSFGAAVMLIFLANSAGALLSIDSITQTWAAAFGIWSAVAYIRLRRGRIPIWLMLGLLSCFSKETGVVFFICGPVLYLLSKEKRLTIKNSRTALIGIIPAALYTVVYLLLRHQYQIEFPPPGEETTAVCINGMPDWSVRCLTPMHNEPSSYVPHPLVLIKNIIILFICGVWPIDTVAVTYHQWLPAIITLLLGIGGPFLIYSAYRQADRRVRQRSIILLALAAIVSLPSFITRAGEISPFTSNTILVMAVFSLLNNMKWSTPRRIALVGFILATCFTLTHKYIVAYQAGERGREMAKEVKAHSPENPRNVLWIGIDEAPLDAGGAIFTNSPYKNFNHGSAVIREYDYLYPLRLDKRVFPHDYVRPEIIDSLVATNINRYDCIWVTQGSKTKIYLPQ